jgi:nucleotide-binding universal stress UspA family protein
MKNLLITLDGSKQSEAVLPIALTVARECDYQPILLSVWETGAEEPPESEWPRVVELTDRGTEYLRAYQHGLAPRLDQMGLSVTLEIRAGHPAVEIISAAQDRQADMIAMCTHGRRAVPGGRRGSVADKVLRGSPVPVLAVGPRTTLPEPGRPVRIRRILVPLDGSPEAEEAVPLAVDLAQGLQSEIDLLRAVTPAVGRYAEELPGGHERELDRHRERVAKRYLAAVQEAYKGRVISTHTEIGFPSVAIAGYVERSHIDLVVMTSHSRYAAGLWTLGGVADSIIDGPVPVVLVRPSTA